MNSFEHKGYVGKVEYDDSIEAFHGRVLLTKDVVTFEGTSVRSLKKAFRDSVGDYLKMCEERGEEPERPFSGSFALWLPIRLHHKVALAAEVEGTSLNKYIVNQFEQVVGRELTN